MEIERKALYNLLRMHWLRNPQLRVQSWQVENLRQKDVNELFEGLKKQGAKLNRDLFLAYAENCDSPEDLADCFITEEDDVQKQDQIYLLTFELWRRLLPEKLSLSLFCDELDYQIHLYDSSRVENAESLQDAIANLQNFLEDNIDPNTSPFTVFQSVEAHCATDLESFLYDYIADQIDAQQIHYAEELLDSFEECVTDRKWFNFLRARVKEPTEPEVANELIRDLIYEARSRPDLEFNLELLEYLAGGGSPLLFILLAKATLPLLQIEEDLRDLLALCLNYYARLDREKEETALSSLLFHREQKFRNLEQPLDPLDPILPTLWQTLEVETS